METQSLKWRYKFFNINILTEVVTTNHIAWLLRDKHAYIQYETIEMNMFNVSMIRSKLNIAYNPFNCGLLSCIIVPNPVDKN